VTQRILTLVILATLVHAVSAAAQPPRYLSRFDFRVDAEHLSGDDERFVWDANIGGDVDLVDYGTGRLVFAANYQVVLGEEIKAFDPNQGHYILEGALTRRFDGFELAGVFYHQSRHLSDRPKRQAVDWNSVGGRVRSGVTNGALRLDGRADLRVLIQHAFVDYDWEVEANGRARYAVHPRIAFVSSAALRVVGVDGSRDRGTQTGVRGEGGVRLEGDGAAAELFLAVERRIDPYQLEFGTATWFTAGFRIASR
jgi:hypothetical protein